MIDAKQKPEVFADLAPQKIFFQVFLSFKKPDGYVSLFIESVPTGCGIHHKLAQIFNRTPAEMDKCLCELAWGGCSGSVYAGILFV